MTKNNPPSCPAVLPSSVISLRQRKPFALSRFFPSSFYFPHSNRTAEVRSIS